MWFTHKLTQGLCVILLLSLLLQVESADTKAWNSRFIYQTMTDRFARTVGSTTHACNTSEGLYCGGIWRGMIDRLDYIQGMGFDAVMIFPVAKNVEGRVSYGEVYHRYWVQEMYTLNPHFGTHEGLLDLSKALHNRCMFLMMDYATLYPFNDSKYFHPYCKITDYNDYSLAQKCWTGDDIVPLPDLKTEDKEVQKMLEKWIQETMSTYSIDGLRLDAAKHIISEFLPLFQKATGDAFITGEVFNKSVQRICSYQAHLPSMPNYPIYFSMLDAFTRGNTTALPGQVEIMKHNCRDVAILTTFSENRDIARFASFKEDMNLAKNALIFTILFDGTPIIYQGQEQHLSGAHDPDNRETLLLSNYDANAPLYKLISTLNTFRKHAFRINLEYLNTPTHPIFKGLSEVAFRQGREGRQRVMALPTQGTNSGAYTIRMMNGYQPSYIVIDVFSCDTYKINDRGEPRVLFPVNLMHGSGLCRFDRANGSSEDFMKRPLNDSVSGGGFCWGSRPVGWSALRSLGLVCLVMFVL